MTTELLLPTSDIVFRMLFGSERNTDILSAFLKAVLLLPGDELAEVAIMNPLLDSEFPDVKATILDVKAKTASGRRIDIEMQMDNYAEMKQRIMFYTAKMFTEQVGPGDDYDRICPVVCILVTDFRMIENAYYHNRYRLHDPRTGSEFTDLLEINVLELPKTPGAATADDAALLTWLKFLKAKNREEMEMLAQGNPEIQKAVKRLVELSADDKARMIYEARLKLQRDKAAYGRDQHMKGWEEGREEGWEEGREEGLEEGLEKGREEGWEESRIEFARKMLQHSHPLEEIVEMTGLSMQKIRALQAGTEGI